MCKHCWQWKSFAGARTDTLLTFINFPRPPPAKVYIHRNFTWMANLICSEKKSEVTRSILEKKMIF